MTDTPLTDDKLADLLRVAEAKAHVEFVSDPREHHNRAIAFDRAFSPPTAAALVRELQRLRHDAYVETLEHRPVDIARADAAEEEVARLRADLAAAVTLLRESRPVVSDAAAWLRNEEHRRFNVALCARFDDFLATQEAAK